MQESKGSFVTFHDNKPLEPLVNERWEDFNVKVNVTLPELLAWVCVFLYATHTTHVHMYIHVCMCTNTLTGPS